MAGAKEIRTQIGSIQNTQKITSAMQMVAASKMRRAQDRMQQSRPYAERIRQVVGHVASSNPEYQHAYMEKREVKRVGYIVVSSDRGLCGGLNSNMFRTLVPEMKEWEEQGVEIDLCLIGTKAAHFFKAFGGRAVAALTHVGEEPNIADLIGGVKVMLDAFEEGTIDRLYVVYNHFINTMSQKPTVQQLLPLLPNEGDHFKHAWDYLYEPDAKELLDGLLIRYIESQVYQAVVENGASEQSARMVAMKSSTENAGNMIDQLQLVYNKARQAAITQEIAEICGGAAAV